MPTTHRTGKDELQSIAHEAMLQRGLLPDFSPAVIAETNGITHAAAASGAVVRDLRGMLWASIDNDDSLDLDQLSVAEPVAGGAVRILVAIADVDALVKKDCAIDSHASTNTTSVYTAAEVFPMLPEKLSTDLTSLGEGQERLAIWRPHIWLRTPKTRASPVTKPVTHGTNCACQNLLFVRMVGRVGIEPTTNGLRVPPKVS